MTDIKKLLEFGQSFCVYPFLHLHIDTEKNLRLCCISKDAVQKNNLDFNSIEFDNIRKKLIENKKIKNCEKCYNLEKNKTISPRQKAIVEFKDQIEDIFNNNQFDPIWYDLRISNNCNLTCQMCNYKESSSIAKKLGYNNSHLSYEPDIDINPDVRRIYLAGGEPFLIKKFVKYLEQVKNINCEIVVNTNGTIVTNGLLNQLKRFKNVNITLSLDGYDSLNEKIRQGSNWIDIDRNIDIFLQNNFSIHVNTVVQKDNINHLLELNDYLESKNISKWSLSPINGCENLVVDKNHVDFEKIEILKTKKLISQNVSNVLFLNNILKN